MKGTTLFIKGLNECFTVIIESPVQNKTRKTFKKLIKSKHMFLDWRMFYFLKRLKMEKLQL